MTTKQITVARQVLKELAKQVPQTLFSIEKQMFIGNELVRKMKKDHLLVLRRLLNGFLEEMRKVDASDIDLGGLGTKNMIWLRVQGEKKPVPAFGQFSLTEFDILIQSVLLERQMQTLYDNRNLDFSYTFSNGEGLIVRNRANVAFDLNALSMNMRAISKEIRKYEEYQLHPNVSRNLSLSHTKEGLILVTGITGSGKSTTLDAIVDLNNSSVNAHIIVIASPVEFVHESKKCIVRHREVGRDTLSFKKGTIEALRQDPDIIIIGEMRDPETIMAALEVADSGHKVFSTLHTSSAVESIDRIIGEVPTNEQERVRIRLADILKCVISQKLVPDKNGKRVLAKEIMVMTPSIRAAIKNNNTSEIYQMINESGNQGMTTIEQDLAALYFDKKITVENAVSYANNKRRIKQLLKLS